MSKNIDSNFNIIKEQIFNNENYKVNNVYQIKMNWYSQNTAEKIPIDFYAQIKPIGHLSQSTLNSKNNKIVILGFKFIFLQKGNKNVELQNFYYPKKLDFYEEPAKSAILNLRKQFKPNMNIMKEYYEICIYTPSFLTFKQKTILFWESLNADSEISIVENSAISTTTNSPSKTKISSTNNNSSAISSAKNVIQKINQPKSNPITAINVLTSILPDRSANHKSTSHRERIRDHGKHEHTSHHGHTSHHEHSSHHGHSGHHGHTSHHGHSKHKKDHPKLIHLENLRPK